MSWVIPPEARLIESYDDFHANRGGFQILQGRGTVVHVRGNDKLRIEKEGWPRKFLLTDV